MKLKLELKWNIMKMNVRNIKYYSIMVNYNCYSGENTPLSFCAWILIIFFFVLLSPFPEFSVEIPFQLDSFDIFPSENNKRNITTPDDDKKQKMNSVAK